MKLQDNKQDSVYIYCDWLEDNDQLELATEVRNCEVTHDCSHYEHKYCSVGVWNPVGGFYFHNNEINGIGSEDLACGVGESVFGIGHKLGNHVGVK